MPKRIIRPLILAGLLLMLVVAACRNRKPAPDKEQWSSSPVPVGRTTDTVIVRNNPVKGPITERLTTTDYYQRAYSELKNMLLGRQPENFKRAVFVVENAYLREGIPYETFTGQIEYLKEICENWMQANCLKDYQYPDSINMLKNCAVFQMMKDTIYLTKSTALHLPYAYDFEDFTGEQDWSKQFVIKLLATGSGNCHSLPYLYKILIHELSGQAYLSLAPSHIYLKHRCKKIGWYNTELTSGEFPTDAWIKASGYITIEAIRSGIYMDTIGPKQAIAMCLFDLAKGYLAQTGNYTDSFALNCCDLALKHYPVFINAIILKAETLRRQHDYYTKLGQEDRANHTREAMKKLYVEGLQLGYREMPKNMYIAWLTSVKEQRDKYTNSQMNETFKPRQR